MRRTRHFLFTLLILSLPVLSLLAQPVPLERWPEKAEMETILAADREKPLSEVEEELAEIANEILNHDSTEYKIERNKEFIVRLMNVLKRPDSYNYGWDSMPTVSILSPEDDEFRIFTWYIVDQPADAYYAALSHYYFGLVQRKYVTKKGETQYLVIPLMEIDRIPRGLETMRLSNLTWLGALYYKPRHQEHLISFDGYYYKLVPRDKAELVTDSKNTQEIREFIPGKFRQRRVSEANQSLLSTHKKEKEDIRYYVLMGWNGWDNKSNYKFLEIMSFDKQDSMRINFGAPIIYYEQFQGLSRGVFKYSEYAPFTLNTGYVKSGLFGLGKKNMIVYDHLATPNASNANEQVWDLGPDGSYDALSFHKKLGVFQWHRDVELVSEYNKKYTEKALRRQLKIQQKREEEHRKSLEMRKAKGAGAGQE